MAKQNFLTEYTEISYHNVGDLVWRLRLNTNMALSLTESEAATIAAEQHIPLLTTSPVGTVVRGRVATDAARSYYPSNSLDTDYAHQGMSNIFTTLQDIPDGTETQGDTGYIVRGKHAEVLVCPSGSVTNYLREVTAGRAEFYTVVTPDTVIGGTFLVDFSSAGVVPVVLLANLVIGTPIGGQVGLTTENNTTFDSYLKFDNQTGSDINIIISKEV